jgi:hypothetical protein
MPVPSSAPTAFVPSHLISQISSLKHSVKKLSDDIQLKKHEPVPIPETQPMPSLFDFSPIKEKPAHDIPFDERLRSDMRKHAIPLTTEVGSQKTIRAVFTDYAKEFIRDRITGEIRKLSPVPPLRAISPVASVVDMGSMI